MESLMQLPDSSLGLLGLLWDMPAFSRTHYSHLFSHRFCQGYLYKTSVFGYGIDFYISGVLNSY